MLALHIGAQNLEIGVGKSIRKCLLTCVKLVISESHHIITGCIEHINLDVTTHLCKIRGSLTEIASVQKQNILLAHLLAHLTDVDRLLDNTAMAIDLAESLRLYMAMRIIQVQNCKILSCQGCYSSKGYD